MKKYIIIASTCIASVLILTLLNLIEDFPFKEIIFALISAVILVIGIVLLKLSVRKVTVKRFLGLLPFRVRDIGVFIWMMLAAITGSYILNFLEIKFWSIFNITVSSGSSSFTTFDNFFIVLLSFGLVPAIFEELFFRGAVLFAFEEKKPFFALLISSLFFFVIHGSPFGSLSTVFAGMAFGCITMVTGSVFPAMIAHLVSNMLTYVLNIYSERLSLVGMDYTIVFVLLFVFLLSLYLSLVLIYRKYKVKQDDRVTILNEGEVVWERQKRKRKEQSEL